ncbi:MAG TPA: ferritin-like domain-containing protein [Acidimicrobiales bacterium]|nr:ferritin-like domain-containing protein [Acidimicrobiales bacterium]
MPLSEDELFVLSFYRSSEINGSLFFGRLARALKPSPIQHDLSKHFADEAQHAWYWTDCIDRLGARPLKLADAYQDRYLEAVGLPVNMMEVLAITLVFERRVINQYAKHLAATGLQPEVKETIDRIMEDERWHVQWVRDALGGFETRFGKEHVDATLKRYREADREVYAEALAEYEERFAFLTDPNRKEQA